MGKILHKHTAISEENTPLPVSLRYDRLKILFDRQVFLVESDYGLSPLPDLAQEAKQTGGLGPTGLDRATGVGGRLETVGSRVLGTVDRCFGHWNVGP